MNALRGLMVSLTLIIKHWLSQVVAVWWREWWMAAPAPYMMIFKSVLSCVFVFLLVLCAVLSTVLYPCFFFFIVIFFSFSSSILYVLLSSFCLLLFVLVIFLRQCSVYFEFSHCSFFYYKFSFFLVRLFKSFIFFFLSLRQCGVKLRFVVFLNIMLASFL